MMTVSDSDPITFTRTDYEERLNRTRQRMAAAGVDLLVSTDPANIHYLTGYDGWSFYVPQCVLVPTGGGDPVWVGREMDANAARVTTFLTGDSILSYPDHYVQSPDRHPFDYVADVIRGRNWGNLAIGLEMDSYYLSPAGYEGLRKGLPNAVFKSAEGLVNWVRVVKSDKEIALMQRAGRVMTEVMAVARAAVAPGVRQHEAVAQIYHAQISGVDGIGGDYTAIVPMLPTGKGTSTPHLTWTNEPFKEGEATIMELAACHRRYHCPQARTMFLGKPPQKLVDAAKAVVEGIEAALATVRPGVTCEAVEAAWRATIARHGLVKDSRIGYSVGLNYPPDWGEHTLSLRPGDRTLLQPNMCIHMIPGIWQDDWGIEISEAFRVTERGAELLADTPRELFVKE